MKKEIKNNSFFMKMVLLLSLSFSIFTIKSLTAYADADNSSLNKQKGDIEDVLKYVTEDGIINVDKDGFPKEPEETKTSKELRKMSSVQRAAGASAASYFNFDNWQTDSKINLHWESINVDQGRRPKYETRKKVQNKWTLSVKGDTNIRLEDYGRSLSFPPNYYWKFDPQAKVTIYNFKNWQDLPGRLPFLGSDYEYIAPMQLNSRLDAYSNGREEKGGFFNVPTEDIDKLPPKNNTIKDDTVSILEPNVKVKPIIYDFSKLNEVAHNEMEFGFSLYSVDGGQWGGARRILSPQIVKVEHRDIETGAKLAEPERLGLNGSMNTPVSTTAKTISKYNFDHYEYVDSKNKTEVGAKGDKTWKGETTTTKKGIVFFYSKIPEVKNWTVEFEPEGGAPKPATQTVKDGELAKEPTGSQVPKKGDSIFGGWYTDKSLTTKYKFSTPVKSNIKLYAKWTDKKNWTVTYHTKEKWIERSSPKPNPEYVQDGNKATKPEKDPLGHKYHRTYSANNPKAPDADIVPATEDDKDVRTPDLIFLGWYIDENFTKEYDFSLPVHSDVDLYAKWKPNPGAGMFKKAFNRDTLMKTHDEGPYKAPGNQLTDIRVNQSFSYMAIARNILPNREDLEITKLTDAIPAVVSTPTNVELFTVDAKWIEGKPYQVIEDYNSLKSHKVPKKSEVASPDTDEYYEILPNSYGEDILYIRNIKQNAIKGSQYYGFMFDTKLVKRPNAEKDNSGVDQYKFMNKADLHNKNQVSYTPLMDGKFGGGKYILSAYATVHVPWKVEFEPNGGTPKPKDQFVRNEKLAEKPTGDEVPKKAGFEFEGWYKDKGLAQEYNFNDPVVKDITLYAKWKETKKWTVTFHPGDDVIKRTTPDPNPQYVEDGGLATKPVSKYSKTLIGKEYHPTVSADAYREFDPDDPSQGPEGVRIPNQKFISWYEDKALTQEYDFETPVKKDIDLYAKWELNPALGAQLKSFDRDTLETKYDDGPYKAPGNKITDVRVGDKLSYQLMMRNIFTDRPNAKLGVLKSELPDEIETPTKVEFFTIDGKGNGAIQEPVYETLKVHEILEKSKVSSPDKDEYYEVVTDTDGKRTLYFHNIKANEIKGRNFIGIMYDTKLVKQPKINAAKEYVFYGKTDQQVQGLFSYHFWSNGNLAPAGFIYFANNAVHVPWKVEFEPNGGTPKPKDQLVRNEKLAKEPTGKEVPKKADKVFGGWYKDKNLTDKYNFNTKVTSDMILYAKWDELPAELDLDKTSDKKLYEAKEVVHYTITMKNKTNGVLKDARLGDMIPEGLSKPENIKLDNVLLKEGSTNANSEGAYYTWNPVERTLTLHYKELSGKGERKLTYDSTVVSGKANETKTNKAIFTGSNSKGTAGTEYSIKIVGPKAKLHVKQEVVGKHNEIVVPKMGYLQLDHVNTTNTADKKNQVSLTMPSYEADTDKPYKDVLLKLHYGYTGYLPKEVIPEFYNYDGYQLTTDNGNHKSANRTASKMPVLDLKDNQEYWLTIYVKPKTGEDGPPFYNWDSKTNDFGLVKSFFDWENWQKDAKLLFEYGRKKPYEGIYTKYYLEYEGDTIIRLEDYGRARAAKHSLPAGDPNGMEDPTRNPWETWEPEMGVIVRNSHLWKNIPSKATVDPTTKDASWNGKMATQYLKSDTHYYIGGYFLDTTPDPPEFPLQNGWPNDDIESNFSPLSAKADPIIYDFVDKNIPAEVFVSIKQTTNQTINHIYEAGNRNTFTPQMIKAQFRDIDSNQQISPEQVKGKGGRYKDSISFSAENVSGYTFDHYEYVDSRENKEIGNKGDSTWNGQMTSAKKGIVFWYKKN